MTQNKTTSASVSETSDGIQSLFEDYVVPTYGRFPLTLERGEGSQVWDVDGRRYLDMGGGIAVNSLGHSHPEWVKTISDQAATLTHCCNLYYHSWQGRLAQALVERIGPGKCFFANSGAEANEGMIKLARKFGHEEGRFEILTCLHSFHGRTMAGIAATGQDKVKQGFSPMMPGFRHVPFNDLKAMEKAISPSTVAIMIEGIQGEGGICPADPAYLRGLRALCDKHRLLLLWDGVQCGHYRTGSFQSYSSILADEENGDSFLPDAISMAKSIGGGFPFGAFWVREPYQDILGPGTHGTTFGGTPLGCSVALKILEIIERDRLDQNAVEMGKSLTSKLRDLAGKYPQFIQDIRGMGLMIGIVFHSDISALSHDARPVSLQMVERLHAHGMLTIPSGVQVVRFLPALNITSSEVEEALSILNTTLESIES
jgi:acetylornithine/N-succinyldiaminopimelate aminotransferase